MFTVDGPVSRSKTSPTRRAAPLFRLALILVGASLEAGSLQADIRDGRLFDPGIHFMEPAPTAPADLGRLTPWIGDWQMTQELHRGEEVLSSSGRARFSFMNRGHAVLERTRLADFDGAGHAMATLAFWSVDPQGTWTVGEGNSWTESIGLWNGTWAEDASEDGPGRSLVLHDAIRPGGGPLLLLLRRTYRVVDADRFSLLLETSADLGTTWQTSLRRDYRRAPASEGRDFFPVRADVGRPSPDRTPESAEFDFLLGEFTARHWQLGPDGPSRRTSEATAVYVLDGKAILEFDHADSPIADAATSILRIYNTSMRRWESLFLPNRTHRPLYFGGVREDDRIVLHLFDPQTGPGSVHQWIFFDVRQDSYRWKGLLSADRGSVYSPTWAIDFVRKGTSRPEAEVTPILTHSPDGTTLHGDHYRAARPAAKTLVLFHLAGGDARGEYADVARRLQSEGHEVFAWDVRGGGDRFGTRNRTIDGLDSPFEGSYCDVYPDLVAALDTSFRQGSGGPLFVVGSSFSAALAVRLAAERGNLLTGTVAFSPASDLMGECAVEQWLAEIGETPLLVFRPESELEVESVRSQKTLLEEDGIEVFTATGVHGASLLHPDRSKDAEAVWERLAGFLETPKEAAYPKTP